MNRAFGVFLTFLFLIIASLFFLWLRPVALPEPLKPVGNWFDERKSALTGDSASKPEALANTPPSASTGADTEPERVDLASSRSSVAEVTVDSSGTSTVKAPASSDGAKLSATDQSNGQQASASPAHANKANDASTSGATVAATAVAATASKAGSDAAGAAVQVASKAKSAARLAVQTAATDASQAVATSAATSGGSANAGQTNQQASTVSTTAPETAAAQSENAADRVENGSAAAATNALAAATARVTRRAAALERVEREQASQATETVATSVATPAAPIQADSGTQAITGSSTNNAGTARAPALAPAIKADAAAAAGSATPPLAASIESTEKPPAPVALLKPEVKTAPPVTAAAVRQQETITNYLEGRRVEFEVGRDTLSPRGIAVLDRLVPLIKANAGTTITIQGHTDDVGDYSSNLELSGARAIAARKYLISQGIKPERLKVQGMGERYPIADNNTQSGRIQNRRIDFAVSDAG